MSTIDAETAAAADAATATATTSGTSDRGSGSGSGASGGAGTGEGTGTGTGRGLLTSKSFWAGYGVLMAVMGTRLPMWSWPPSSDEVVELVFNVLLFPALAQPHTGRPVLASMRVQHMANAHRNTVLAGLFVILVASGKPPAWAAGVDALLLAGYLLMTDALSVPPSVMRRLASPGSLLALAGLIAGTTALVAMPASAGAYRPVLAAAGAAAALGAAVATAFGSAEERRVGSTGEPNAETGAKKARDRSSE
jgi:hypothetical protein